ncbi:MAG: SGNH/GDSL hydrolase family protein [Planctomycetes bacterium]|nr:SGNH/GDSL hydrolase family protein [Planctomycetota bacterium]
MLRLHSVIPALLLMAGACTQAAEPAPTGPALKAGDHVAVIGDSITEQKLYSRFIEVYLLASSGVADLDVAQFGWGGERASGWLNRWQKSVEWFKPTVATTCYGMNDGTYRAYTDEIGKNYREPTAKYVEAMKKAGVRELVVGSPGVVDTVTWKNATGAAVYNQNLEKLGALGKEVATAQGVRSADVHHPMLDAMAKAKAAYGDGYHVGGGDGVHPADNGHLLMAAAFLSALGCDGEIARITFKADGTATASAGHTVAKTEANAVELDSARWPFVLAGDGKAPNSTRSIAAHTDFLEKLDRFTVVMPECTWAKATITWGEQKAVVDGAQLKAGVNLMAVFAVTPFDKASDELQRAVAAQQDIETQLVKNLICLGLRPLIDADAEAKVAMQKVLDRVVAVRNEKAAAARALVKPVRHRIAVAKAE